MIIYFSEGRLGNQLFQYAFLTTIAKPTEKIIVFSMNELFEVFDVYNYNFKNIKISNRYIRFMLRKFFVPILSKFFEIMASFKIVTFIKQKKIENIQFPELIIKKGILPFKFVNTDYFQSETFFNKIVLKNIKIKEKYIKEARKIINSLPQDHQIVFVHIRRGDCLPAIFMGKKGVNLPKRYYIKAISELQKELKKPFYIFLSDDPDYVEDCFEEFGNKLVSRNDMGVDFALMTLCEYGICSNSTFSWWGAYLMENRKKVIFPKYWYGWKVKKESHLGIYPQFATVLEID
jgi:hypothetical protein